ncbi:serine dehydratase beta chain, partial [Rhizobium ruizarguesonis]
MFLSVFDVFKIGVWPSSSHTMGPMSAANRFRELGLELEGRAAIEGEWEGRVTGLGNQHVEIAMMRTPDGHSRL